ncbi:MAG: RDD family protein [Acidobacteria bacterium]|nr:RDD family protein [Acidobacteriota bacterium]
MDDERQDTEALPEWRKELNKRLLEIQRRRGPSVPKPSTASLEGSPQTPSSTPREGGVRNEGPRALEEPSGAPPSSQVVSMPFRRKRKPGAQRRQSEEAHAPEYLSPLERPLKKEAPDERGQDKTVEPLDSWFRRSVREQIRQDLEPSQKKPDGTILLSRTLAGLLDLVLVLMLAGLFTVLGSMFSTVDDHETALSALFFVLLALFYFIYSVFFLVATRQTIGMMLSGLEVLDNDGGKPSPSQAVLRTLGFFLAAGTMAAGLLWGIFEPEGRCWQDLISRTRVHRT